MLRPSSPLATYACHCIDTLTTRLFDTTDTAILFNIAWTESDVHALPHPDLSMLTYLAKALLLQSLAVLSPVSVFSDEGSSSLASQPATCQTQPVRRSCLMYLIMSCLSALDH